MSGDFENFNNALPGYSLSEHFPDRNRLNVLGLAPVHDLHRIP
jgi:hypothetical protein